MKKAVAIIAIASLISLAIVIFFIHRTSHGYVVHASPEEVRSFIKVGMNPKLILNRFGEPQMKAPEGDGAEMWEYFVSPDDPVREFIIYGGFSVIVKDKKVTYFSLMR